MAEGGRTSIQNAPNRYNGPTLPGRPGVVRTRFALPIEVLAGYGLVPPSLVALLIVVSWAEEPPTDHKNQVPGDDHEDAAHRLGKRLEDEIAALCQELGLKGNKGDFRRGRQWSGVQKAT